ncbi:hypothetical protein DPMN_034954 [Dreissena polymorpha]|uniref:Ig-like domain-containing protein n=1 Tax=Dreissena polymorpha TaxID=45954 RepID=A0A9D4RMG2_DREPO|nr:hypothetical protein DPMN_034954 [Dreissena polymorpha]
MVCPNAQNLVIKDGDSRTLECVPSPSKPSAIIQWFKDSGTPETTANDTEFSVSDTNVTVLADTSVKSILYFKAAQRDNTMSIYCTACNVGKKCIIRASEKTGYYSLVNSTLLLIGK